MKIMILAMTLNVFIRCSPRLLPCGCLHAQVPSMVFSSASSAEQLTSGVTAHLRNVLALPRFETVEGGKKFGSSSDTSWRLLLVVRRDTYGV